MAKRAALSPCGHKVTLDNAALAAIENTARASYAESGKQVASLRCPRCGKVGVPVPVDTEIGKRSPLIERITAPPLPRVAQRTDPAAARPPAPAPAPATAPAPAPPDPEIADLGRVRPDEEPAPPAVVEEPAAPAGPDPNAPRIVIGGGPRTGKTTYADTLGWPVRHTDDLIATHSWSDASAEVARWMTEPGPWVIEGVTAIRALRKALAAGEAAPCDCLVWLTEPHEPRNSGQESLAKGCQTVYLGIRQELTDRGVVIEEDPPT